MQPRELVEQLERGNPEAVYLFVGPETHARKAVRAAFEKRVFGDTASETGLERIDLEETPLASILDDASSLSLFASRRLLWVTSAEAALPRRITTKAESEAEGPAAALAAYVRNPSPDTVLVFDCSRYALDGDDKAKVERVRKFYAAIPAVVEFPALSASEAARLARQSAEEAGLRLTAAQIGVLVDALDSNATRIVSEVEKLALYASGGTISDGDLAAMIPNARTSSIFLLVNALARGDRSQALEILDALVREGEYLPLVLTFLATQFRLALSALEGNARNPAQIQAHFAKARIPMWRSRAEQVAETLRVFPPARLRQALLLTHQTDVALRDTRPDDRTVVETLVWKLTEGTVKRS